MIHETAIVEKGAVLGHDVNVWAFCQVRAGASIGDGSNLGSHGYIDSDVVIGKDCKIQTGVRIFRGVTIGDGVFVGPGCIVTNDLRPRAINADGTIKRASDWTVTKTNIGTGASLGAGSIIVAGANVGEFALVGAGSTVTREVLPHAIVVGSPARRIGWACHCGERLVQVDNQWRCPTCQMNVPVPSE
ncbi:MAG: acyltransferase [Acidimicrobiia bacterium]|nr:MAG: acyltransferase [Acidimicrobiia bacterium]